MKRLIQSNYKTIKLLHGTNSTVIDSILEHGLLPEGLTGNAMFNYNDYGRKGEPKHADSVYLTNDLENAQRYANNAVKHNGGFPIVIEVEVSEDSLSWDDDAFYKNYGDFDFGERNEHGFWERKPKKELWQQSLDINNQCTHFGKINPHKITKIFLESKWWKIEDFVEILSIYKKLNIELIPVNVNEEIKLREFIVNFLNYGLNLEISMFNREIFLYNLHFNNKSLSLLDKTAISIKTMEILKENIAEFGAKVVSSSDLKKVGINPKKSSLNYVFGSFSIKNNKSILTDIEHALKQEFNDNKILQNIIKGEATVEEFDSIYKYNPDFTDNLIYYCKNVLNYNNDKLIKVLESISNHYHDSYEQLSAEIIYLKNKKI